jgi:GTP pyrophosphokinase
LLESQQDSDAQDFFQALKVDMFADDVFVFTPSGDVVNLPAGSTPIDFAYSIHSEIGNKMTGALVNGRMVPYAHVLNNGDIVRILTSNSAKGPSRDWLDIIRSPEARNKIRQWFKREKREENIIHGKMAFEAELRRSNLHMSDIMRDDTLQKSLERISFSSLDELFAAIGYGGITAHKVVNKIRDEVRAAIKIKKKEEQQKPEKAPDERVRPVSGVMVEGLDNCLVKFARCCSPVPGDPIVGFITRGFGVSVHRQDCGNYLKSENVVEDDGRWVRVAWANTEDRVYPAEIRLTVRDRTGVVVDVATALNTIGMKMTSFNARDVGSGIAVISIVIEVKNRDDLVSAMARLMSVQGVSDVRRING